MSHSLGGRHPDDHRRVLTTLRRCLTNSVFDRIHHRSATATAAGSSAGLLKRIPNEQAAMVVESPAT